MFNKEELDYIKEVLQDDQSERAETIKLKINDLVKDLGMCVWKFYWDCGRSGDVEGFFRATKEEIEDAIGMNVYFGEILGKHSEVYGDLEECDVKLISDDPVIVNTYNTSGYNPLEYIRYECNECGDLLEMDDFEDGTFTKDVKVCNYCARHKEDEEE